MFYKVDPTASILPLLCILLINGCYISANFFHFYPPSITTSSGELSGVYELAFVDSRVQYPQDGQEERSKRLILHDRMRWEWHDKDSQLQSSQKVNDPIPSYSIDMHKSISTHSTRIQLLPRQSVRPGILNAMFWSRTGDNGLLREKAASKSLKTPVDKVLR